MRFPSPFRLFEIAKAIRKKESINSIYKKTKIDKWFLREIKKIIDYENLIKKNGIPKKKGVHYSY